MERVENYGSMIEQVYLGSPVKSAFDRSHHNYLTGKLGALIPTRLDEVYPGDRIKGHIQGVVNFEPLAAPILGNMRYKQESFYIPDSIIWKNAHKFYTGKKGFCTPKPSVSPLDIVNAYGSYGFLIANTGSALDTFMSYFVPVADDYSAQYQSAVTYLTGVKSNLMTFAERYQIVDLLQPLFDLLDDYFLVNKLIDVDTSVPGETSIMGKQFFADSIKKQTDPTVNHHEEAKILCQFLYEWYNFLFGTSSMIDYMGFPCYTHWNELFNQSTLNYFTTYFGYPESYDYLPFENIATLFSHIPLVWLPFRAAYVVWYWNYRDELLETNALDPEDDLFLGDNPSSTEIVLLTLLRYRCWFKDTFTTALTHTGDGNLGVPIIQTDEFDSATSYKYYNSLGETMDNVTNFNEALQAGASVCSIDIGDLSYKVPMNYFSQQNIIGGSSVRLSDANFLSLDLFERIKRLQKFVQKKLVLGYEYDDVVWSSFLVKLSNVRMRIPEILGRGSDLVELNTVVNNTNTSDQIAGDKTAIAWAQGRQSDINYFAEEHGYFISFMTILPIQSYSGGMQRLWLKREQFDVFWPEFATMGMDAVYNCELSAPTGLIDSPYLTPSGLTDEQAMSVFGYQGRYFDLKSRHDEEHGRMRTDLNYMTFSREFDSKNLPKLNYIFVHCHPNTDMFVMNDSKQDLFRADIFHALDFERRLPVPSDFI